MTNKLVLIIDSDTIFANSLAQTLAKQFKPLSFAVIDEVNQAMQAIDKYSPLAILADVRISGQNLITLLNELVSYNDTLAIPKILLTVRPQFNISDVSSYGVVGMLDKRTYRIQDLIDLINNILAEKEKDESEPSH